MTRNDDYRPRLSVEITKEQHEKLQELVPWGIRKPLFEKIVGDLIDVLEASKSPQAAIGFIINEDIRLSDILDLKDKPGGYNRRSQT